MDLFALAWPFVHLLDPETAHRLAIRVLASGWLPPAPTADPPILAQRLWGLDFPSPIGLAAGFDKHAEAPDALLAQGFGFVEIGTVTPKSQPGNPRPRVFRLHEDRAAINRMGFNSEGLDAAKARLARGVPRGIVGLNLGANKDSPDHAADYVTGLRAVGGLAQYYVVNVSSPNTPGLRGLQAKDRLDDLLERLGHARPPNAPLLVKIAPDLTEAELIDVIEVALTRGIDGLIIGNTTLSRPPELRSPQRGEAGGLSGAPLKALAHDVLARAYRLSGGKLPLVGVGGIASGADAYARIRAGASLVQLYTAMVFEGPGIATRIKRELADLLRRDGFSSVAAAVGADQGLSQGMRSSVS
jgi:dihydroorotate dehydrogenase